MCGIFSYKGTKFNRDQLLDSIDLIKYRGPDNSRYEKIDRDIFFAFHRLSIVGISDLGNQPLELQDDNSLSLICNGEIYNYESLAQQYDFNLTTSSDCEIILHMFNKFGIEKTLVQLDGVFMFSLYDKNTKILYSGRDPYGVRPGFIGFDDSDIYVSSEAKPLVKNCDKIIPFIPGSWWSSEKNEFTKYHKLEAININNSSIYSDVNSIL